MPIPSVRTIDQDAVRSFGKINAEYEISGLTLIQTASYARFLQADRSSRDRLDIGLEAILREVFPIESYDGQFRLEYVRYELGKPRYTPEECRQLRLTYGMPFRVWLRLVKEQPIEEEVYLGDIPIMVGGGEFIINGAERVVVSQLHRSPGVDFVMAEETASSDRKTHSCRIIPERGSWIELLVSKRDAIGVRIDQSGKFSALTLLRAMAKDYSSDADIIRIFYPTDKVKITAKTVASELEGKYSVEDVVFPAKHDRAGELIVDAGYEISDTIAEELIASGVKTVEIVTEVRDPLILKTLAEDGTSTHEEALLKIYQRLRPGNPPNLDKANDLFREKFFDVNRYRLGRVGRFRINRKFQQDISDDEMTLNPQDFINAMKYIVRLRIGDETAQIDDIDNLGKSSSSNHR
jgi:DNA-directed RNA polymerase subunit beta